MTKQETATLNSLIEQMSGISGQLGNLTTLVTTEAERCPHREAIARAANNHVRLLNLEAKVDKHREEIEDEVRECRELLKVQQVKVGIIAGLASAGGVSLIGLIVTAIGRYLGLL